MRENVELKDEVTALKQEVEKLRIDIVTLQTENEALKKQTTKIVVSEPLDKNRWTNTAQHPKEAFRPPEGYKEVACKSASMKGKKGFARTINNKLNPDMQKVKEGIELTKACGKRDASHEMNETQRMHNVMYAIETEEPLPKGPRSRPLVRLFTRLMCASHRVLWRTAI